MHASSTTFSSSGAMHAAFVPAQGSPAAVAVSAGVCGCGQELDARHQRCTRCGR